MVSTNDDSIGNIAGGSLYLPGIGLGPFSAPGFLCADTKQRLASQSPKGQLSRLQR